MTVKRTCAVDIIAIDLNVTGGEWLHYEVELVAGAAGTLTLSNQHGRILMQAPPGGSPWKRDWPDTSDDIELPNDLMHTLGVHFAAAKTYRYTVERVSHEAARNGIVKSCSYTSTDSTDFFLDPLRIFTF